MSFQRVNKKERNTHKKTTTVFNKADLHLLSSISEDRPDCGGVRRHMQRQAVCHKEAKTNKLENVQIAAFKAQSGSEPLNPSPLHCCVCAHMPQPRDFLFSIRLHHIILESIKTLLNLISAVYKFMCLSLVVTRPLRPFYSSCLFFFCKKKIVSLYFTNAAFRTFPDWGFSCRATGD